MTRSSPTVMDHQARQRREIRALAQLAESLGHSALHVIRLVDKRLLGLVG